MSLRLLAGPILRRTDARSVSVWVAFDQPGDVGIRVWEGLQKSAGAAAVQSGDAWIASGSAATVPLGPALHVALVVTGLETHDAGRFRPITPPLRPGALYCYDITFKPAGGGGVVGLRELGLLVDDPAGAGNARAIAGVSPQAPRHFALGYETDALPGFATGAAQLGDIRLAHASCRKVHGPGTDALSWLDQAVADARHKPAERLQQLFLSGDQIYADDVPTCLLPVLHQLAVELVGEETLPHGDGARDEASLANVPPMRRAVLVRSGGGFTTVEAQNHLLTFGEYAAMYLLAWSPRAWRGVADEDACYAHARGASPFPLTNLAALHVGEGQAPPADDAAFRELLRKKNKAEFDAERQRVLVYASTVGKVARLLANVPTYMIFDDHDVTDDWNLNATWRNRVLTRPLGRAIVRNALLAYTFFQAWGSDWRSFSDARAEGEPPPASQPNVALLAVASRYRHPDGGGADDDAAELDGRFGLSPGGERANFHYEAPALLYQVRVLDTRTRRTHPHATGVAPPFLLGDEASDALDAQLPKGPRRAGTPFVLVVSPTPALGPELLDRMLVPMLMQGLDAYRAFTGEASDFDAQPGAGAAESSLKLAKSRTQGAMFFDGETWPANERGQHLLLNRLAGYEKVVVLGGDVHYGTNLAADWWSWDRSVGAGSRRTARIVQLTSSAARNAFEPRIEAIYHGFHWLNQWMFGSGFDGFAWKDGAQLALPAGANVSLLRHSRMKDKPSLLPAYGWPDGTAFAGDEPDWSWRIAAARDERPDDERGGPYEDAADELDADLDAAALLPRGLERSRAIAAVHQKAHALQFAPRREVVLTNNVGIVSFEADDAGAITVVHTQLSTDERGYPEDEPSDELVRARPLGDGAHVSRGSAHTVVRIGLEPTADPRPQPRQALR